MLKWIVREDPEQAAADGRTVAVTDPEAVHGGGFAIEKHEHGFRVNLRLSGDGEDAKDVLREYDQRFGSLAEAQRTAAAISDTLAIRRMAAASDPDADLQPYNAAELARVEALAKDTPPPPGFRWHTSAGETYAVPDGVHVEGWNSATHAVSVDQWVMLMRVRRDVLNIEDAVGMLASSTRGYLDRAVKRCLEARATLMGFDPENADPRTAATFLPKLEDACSAVVRLAATVTDPKQKRDLGMVLRDLFILGGMWKKRADEAGIETPWPPADGDDGSVAHCSVTWTVKEPGKPGVFQLKGIDGSVMEVHDPALAAEQARAKKDGGDV